MSLHCILKRMNMQMYMWAWIVVAKFHSSYICTNFNYNVMIPWLSLINELQIMCISMRIILYNSVLLDELWWSFYYNVLPLNILAKILQHGWRTVSKLIAMWYVFINSKSIYCCVNKRYVRMVSLCTLQVNNNNLHILRCKMHAPTSTFHESLVPQIITILSPNKHRHVILYGD